MLNLYIILYMHILGFSQSSIFAIGYCTVFKPWAILSALGITQQDNRLRMKSVEKRNILKSSRHITAKFRELYALYLKSMLKSQIYAP